MIHTFPTNRLPLFVLWLGLSTFGSSQCLAMETITSEQQVVHPFLKNNPFKSPSLVNSGAVNNLVTATVSGDGLDLRGVLMSSNNPMVNVNGEILSVGDVIDGYRLLDVTEKKAVFEKQENRITLELLTELPL